MYPYGDLPGNLAAFCATLRREHGFRLGPGELRDAARALEVVDVADQRRVRHALRATLASNRDDTEAFDGAFDAFFFPGPTGVPQPGHPPLGRRSEGATAPGPADGQWRTREGEAPEDDERAGGTPAGASPAAVDHADETGGLGPVRLARALYSPFEAEGRAAITLRPVDAAWRESARALVRHVQIGLSRRWRPGRRGRRFDLRRTLRASLQTGGEALSPRWLKRARRSPRFVILVDGSRSMSDAEGPALSLAVALAGVTSRVETFTFSTTLRSITGAVRWAGRGRPAVVGMAREAWGGGTNIGASLQTFLQRHGERHLSRETLVIIVSDGLDVGEPGLLRAAMREFHRRAAGVVWLNPLLDTPGYEPTSRGMAAARPFVTTFASVPDARALAHLARLIRLR